MRPAQIHQVAFERSPEGMLLNAADAGDIRACFLADIEIDLFQELLQIGVLIIMPAGLELAHYNRDKSDTPPYMENLH